MLFACLPSTRRTRRPTPSFDSDVPSPATPVRGDGPGRRPPLVDPVTFSGLVHRISAFFDDGAVRAAVPGPAAARTAEPAQEDQKMSDTTNPTAPATIKITPMVWILKVEACTVAECTVVANRRMAPTAKTTILVATPIIAPPVSTRVTPCDVVPTRSASDANPVWARKPRQPPDTPSTADTRRVAVAVRRCTCSCDWWRCVSSDLCVPRGERRG